MKQNRTEFQLFQKEIEKGTEMAIRHIKTVVKKPDSMCACMHTWGEGGPLISVHLSQTKSSILEGAAHEILPQGLLQVTLLTSQQML